MHPLRLAAAMRSARFAAVAFAAVFASAYASIVITRGVTDLAPVWPANAIALVLLLRTPARAWTRLDLVAGAALGSVLANWLGGSSLPLALWFTGANGVEVFAAFALIRRANKRADGSANALGALLQAGLLAPAVSASLAAAGLMLFAGAAYGAAWLDWYLTAALGMLIVAPLGVSVGEEDWRPLKTAKAARSAIFCTLIVVGAAAAVFTQTSWPLLFVIMPAILYTAYKRRALGAALAVAVVAMIAVPLTAAGRGPLSLMETATPHDRQFLLQLFLLTQSLVALALAATLEERDSLRRAMEARERKAIEDAKAKSRLLMGVAHDIRTPLNAIQGLSELLANDENLPEHKRRYVEGVLGASAQLQSLANDLLDRSRIERGALVLAPEMCVAADLIRAIVAEARDWPEAREVTLKINAPTDLMLWADPVRVGQILRNFLSNAVKYAGAHGPILISARASGDAVRLEVLDRGPGIAPARQHDVFEPFARIGAGDAKGAGVGLSLVKLLAEAQGGRVGFSSTAFVETRFWVDLPARARVGAPMAVGEEEIDIDPETVF